MYPALQVPPQDRGSLYRLFLSSRSSVKAKSIAIHPEDVSRLNEGEFLNDTLIEFGLKYILANLENRDPELADQTKGIRYDAVKSWTNKIDLFSKKYIIIPIHENVHWYLAIITNPGLLLKESSDPRLGPNSAPDPGSDSETKSPSPVSNDVFSENSSADKHEDISLKSPLSKTLRSLQLMRATQQGDDDTAPSRRVLRSSLQIPVDAEAKWVPAFSRKH
ncbi:hypothetical protein BC939DRAFT_479305 [Gamsiella multidivaricata]|uniref:uncharacterized protein n=1 Tax=Gamsiella multidivaricata TaxID=101098 RepID=UPI0022208045|nr:uncharacterized protein BC939DRAFT_479305 [Gamsiella multidivaricata]KAI7819773.1 hypothetical protein BC939DRAFT_479305 [Gamsiella multidivaricata]